MRGVNDDEMGDYIALAEKKDVQVRFIEYMPMGKAREGRYLSADEAEGRMPECKGKIDFITPVSRPFCRQCNRIRVTADCRIRHCLGNNTETDLREILQQDDKTAIELIRAAGLKKPEKGFSAGFETDRGMGNIGG
jgi:cyclic pyranopterin phosphate synthase